VSIPAVQVDALADTVVTDHVDQVMTEFRRRLGGGDTGAKLGPSPPPAGTTGPGVPVARVLPDPSGEHRPGPRRTPARRVAVACRRGTLRVGRDHGIDLVDASEDGLGVRLRVPFANGDEVTIELSRPGVNQPVALTGTVRWCRPSPDGTYIAGVRLRRRLSYVELTNLTGG
jgi:hypothetical protein